MDDAASKIRKRNREVVIACIVRIRFVTFPPFASPFPFIFIFKWCFPNIFFAELFFWVVILTTFNSLICHLDPLTCCCQEGEEVEGRVVSAQRPPQLLPAADAVAEGPGAGLTG